MCASGHGKNGCDRKRSCLSGVAALHLTLSGLRGTVHTLVYRRIPMRNLFTSLRAFGLVAAAVALLVSGHAAQAANPFEMNFWLPGPRYDGRVAPCEAALPTITSQFQEKESNFWNSRLVITAYGPPTCTSGRTAFTAL